MDAAEIVRLTQEAGLPATLAAGLYYGTRTVITLVAVFGPEKLSKRAREVLRIIRRDREPTH